MPSESSGRDFLSATAASTVDASAPNFAAVSAGRAMRNASRFFSMAAAPSRAWPPATVFSRCETFATSMSQNMSTRPRQPRIATERSYGSLIAVGLVRHLRHVHACLVSILLLDVVLLAHGVLAE